MQRRRFPSPHTFRFVQNALDGSCRPRNAKNEFDYSGELFKRHIFSLHVPENLDPSLLCWKLEKSPLSQFITSTICVYVDILAKNRRRMGDRIKREFFVQYFNRFVDFLPFGNVLQQNPEEAFERCKVFGPFCEIFNSII